MKCHSLAWSLPNVCTKCPMKWISVCLYNVCGVFCVVALCSTLRSETRPAPQERTSAVANYSGTLHLTNPGTLQLVKLYSSHIKSCFRFHWCDTLKFSAKVGKYFSISAHMCCTVIEGQCKRCISDPWTVQSAAAGAYVKEIPRDLISHFNYCRQGASQGH